ncbi:MAG: hypothetical protein IT282_16895 [Bacteroidetes bacterium]|nr:hypothetical protein [Bacteroidota bacterium]
MNIPFRLSACMLLSGMLLISCTSQKEDDPAMKDLAQKAARFTPAPVKSDISRLSPGNRAALAKLVAAAKVMDTLYRRQVWSGNEQLLQKLESDSSPLGKLRLAYWHINQSPWSSLDHNEPFIEGVPNPRPPAANFYPEDMTKEEFQTWLAGLPETDQRKATGFFYTIRRNPDRSLTTVPYNEEYRPELERAATLLREAAAQTDNASLRTFLSKRADAFLSNDYYESDVAWMELDSPIDVTIGPYEVYLDELFNYKAAFEAFVTLRNDEETAKLEKFSSLLQDVEDNLPIAPALRNPKLGGMAPIRVVDEVMVGGESRAGVQTAAFNLPNDERVVAEKGSKRVMLKNVQEAKFRQILTPIASVVMAADQKDKISFEPFFTHILAHELMHGLGPHNITLDGTKTTVRQSMKELSSAFEEAKADISALFMLQHLMDKGVLDKSGEQQMYATFLAGVFRSVRFGIKESHGRGMAFQFNYLVDAGAFVYDSTGGTFSVDFERIKPAVRDLTGLIMTVQAEGNYAKAKELLDTYAVIRPPMQKALDRLKDIPVDIAPVFTVEEELTHAH